MKLTLAVVEAVLQKLEASLLLLEEISAGNILLVELTNLKEDMEFVQARLLDVQTPELDPWNLEIRRCLYAADDFLDEIFTAATRRKLTTGCGTVAVRFLSFLAKAKAKAIRQQFRDVESVRARDRELVLQKLRLETRHYVNPSDIVGRDTDKYAITKMLISNNQFSVIVITGIPGIGKTTVSQLLYNDDIIIRQHFELRLWVCVGLEFNLANIMKMIIEQMGFKPSDLTSTDLAQTEIQFRELLLGKKFLLVLDDVCTIHPISWRRFKALLSAGAAGSKIILTTCSEQVTSLLGTVELYDLRPLSDAEAWSLFRRMAFGRELEDNEDLELQYIGREILTKSGNVPLSIRIVASHLFGQDKTRWMALKDVARLNKIIASKDTHQQQPSPVGTLGSETWSYADDSNIFGRDTDKDAIINMLLSDNQGEKFSVILITGTAGVGKTTLAQLVFNDIRVKQHFDLQRWIWFGLQFDLSNTMHKIIQPKTSDHEGIGLEQLQKHFRSTLLGQKYLFVLDDVYNFNPDIWREFINLSCDGAAGSRIIVTTRHEQLPFAIATVNSYEVRPLSDYHAWSLFKSIAFNLEQDNEALQQLGRKILKKTGNVPLNVEMVGSLLHSQDERKWVELNNLEILPYQGIRNILKPSYHQLLSSSKRCFAYCAIFPGGYDIRKREVMQLWIAQGFVRPALGDRSTNQSLEDAAEDCFTDLKSWSFFKDMSRDEQGDICSFKMNDLELDLAQSVAANENKGIHTMGNNTLSSGIYHVSVDGWSNLQESVISQLPEELRSLINISQSTSRLTRSHCAQLLSRLRLLRALDLHASDILVVPNTIGSLRHLRYLNLSYNPFKSLPNSLTGLVNLQVLDLSCCKKLVKLPSRLRRLVSLRHLYLSECEKLTGMPVGMGQMTSLQTLSHFVLGKGKNSCKLDELSSLNLKAELTIVFASQQ